MKQRPFLALWTLAVAATVAAFVLHLALRGRTVDLGYRLGRSRAEQARLREVKRVLSLEAASYQTPQRVEMVARSPIVSARRSRSAPNHGWKARIPPFHPTRSRGARRAAASCCGTSSNAATATSCRR